MYGGKPTMGKLLCRLSQVLMLNTYSVPGMLLNVI